MVNKHKVSPERFRHLSQLIQISFKTKDWHSLQRHDIKLRQLLTALEPQPDDPQLLLEIENVKAIHREAFAALQQATEDLSEELNTTQAHTERAKAYELAVFMGH